MFVSLFDLGVFHFWSHCENMFCISYVCFLSCRRGWVCDGDGGVSQVPQVRQHLRQLHLQVSRRLWPAVRQWEIPVLRYHRQQFYLYVTELLRWTSEFNLASLKAVLSAAKVRSLKVEIYKKRQKDVHVTLRHIDFLAACNQDLVSGPC